MVITEAFQPVVVALAIVPMAIGPRMATSKKLTAMITTSLTPNPISFSSPFTFYKFNYRLLRLIKRLSRKAYKHLSIHNRSKVTKMGKRTTIILDDDVDSEIRKRFRHKGDLSKIVNTALRKILEEQT